MTPMDRTKLVIVAVVFAFLGFAVAVFVTRDRSPGEDSIEVGFYQDMLTHHEQALGIARLTIAGGENPSVRSYAADVLIFQGFEIGVMTEALDDWGFGPEDRSDRAMEWMDMGVPLEQMPGLLTDEQMDEIRDADGAELDALFLEYMAEHHRGGVHMAEYAALNADRDSVRDLAARMAVNQATEINEYRVVADRYGFEVDIDPATLPDEVSDIAAGS
jgi:uncharacterized protein (DUF305 family)